VIILKNKKYYLNIFQNKNYLKKKKKKKGDIQLHALQNPADITKSLCSPYRPVFDK
jgi:ABC-type metal ion transport system substrate-binding protein